MQTELYLLRHGQCEQEGIMRGHVDAKLTPHGLVQMEQSFKALNIIPNYVWCSPLSRCAGFAQSVASQIKVELNADNGLKEMNFGDWDGGKIEELYKDYPEALDTFWRNPWSQTPPNGESMVKFEARVDEAWKRILAECQGKRVLVVTHAGVMRHLLASILARGEHQFFSQLDLPYAKAIKVTVYHDEQGDDFTRVHL